MKKSIKLVSVALASLMAASAFSITASALPRPTKEECEAVGEQKIYFEFPDGTWGDWSNLKINKLNNTLPVYCNPYAVYGNEKEFFDPGWETKPGVCTYTGEGKTVYYDINSEMNVNHYSGEIDPETGKKKKLYYYRYMETEPGKDYGVLFSTTANGGFQTTDVNMTADCLGDTVVLDDPISTRENAATSAKIDYFAHWKNHSDLVTKANVLSTGKFVDGQFPQNQPKAQMLSNALKEYLTNFINVGYFQLESNQKIMEKLGVTPQEVYDQYMKDNADIINGGTVEPANPDQNDVDNGCPVDFIRYDKEKLNMDVEHKKLASPKEVRKVLGLPEEEPTTAAPTTEEPTEAPTTEAPTTVAPTTEAPTTEAPTTEAPTTVAPTTEAPTTEAPTTEPKPAEDVFVLAGSSNFVSTGWSPDPDSYKMTKGDDGVYSVVVPEVAAEEGALYQVKVVQFVGGDPANAVWHGMDNTDLNYDFMLSQDCDVTVTYNPTTGEINVTGDGVVPPVYNISKITAVGAGQGNFLNGIVWDPDAADNQMTEVKPGVYEITFEDCDTNTDYQFKFAANGGWDMNWGLVKETEAKLNEPNPAQYNSDNILFNVESEEETVDVTIQLDISNWDTVKKGGATYTIFINRETPVLWGDVDGDGVITTNDATYVQKYSIDLPTTDNFNAAVADVNADGRISVLDATCIQKFVAEFKNGTGRTGQPVVFE
ncbi:dockerin type I domain-containing protein [Ruminococcus sp.]|uniref:pullulanase X25 domain-containing protein n=1 Tax=Ruminococcus sp. TaxID=41978 RepID=UPI00386DC175